MSTGKKSLLLGLAALVALSVALPAQAATYTLDPTRSFLTLEVLLVDPDSGDELVIATAQLPGSDTAFIQGTLEATVAAGEITLGGGSVLDFLEYTGGPLLPAVGGGSPGDPGTPAPADFGLSIDLADPNFGSLAAGPGAIRLAFGDISGGPETITGTKFDASNMSLALTAGTLDVNLESLFGDVVESVDISGNMAVNVNGGLGFVNPEATYIKVPISLDVVIPVEISEGVELPITARFTGQLATVPEPTSMVMMGIAMTGLVTLSVRRYRRKR